MDKGRRMLLRRAKIENEAKPVVGGKIEEDVDVSNRASASAEARSGIVSGNLKGSEKAAGGKKAGNVRGVRRQPKEEKEEEEEEEEKGDFGFVHVERPAAAAAAQKTHEIAVGKQSQGDGDDDDDDVVLVEGFALRVDGRRGGEGGEKGGQGGQGIETAGGGFIGGGGGGDSTRAGSSAEQSEAAAMEEANGAMVEAVVGGGGDCLALAGTQARTRIVVKPLQREVLVKAKFPAEALEDVDLTGDGEGGRSPPPTLTFARHFPDIDSTRDLIKNANNVVALIKSRRSLAAQDFDTLDICWQCGTYAEHNLPDIAPTPVDPFLMTRLVEVSGAGGGGENNNSNNNNNNNSNSNSNVNNGGSNSNTSVKKAKVTTLKAVMDYIARRLALSVLYGRPAWFEHVSTVMKSADSVGELHLVRKAVIVWSKAIRMLVFAADSNRLGPAIGVRPSMVSKMDLNEVKARVKTHSSAAEVKSSIRVMRAAAVFHKELAKLRVYQLERRMYKLALYAVSMGVNLEEEGGEGGGDEVGDCLGGGGGVGMGGGVEGGEQRMCKGGKKYVFPPISWPGNSFDASALVKSWRVVKDYAMFHRRSIADVCAIGPRPDELPSALHVDVKEGAYDDPIMCIRGQEGVDDDLMAFLASMSSKVVVPEDAKDFYGPAIDDATWFGKPEPPEEDAGGGGGGGGEGGSNQNGSSMEEGGKGGKSEEGGLDSKRPVRKRRRFDGDEDEDMSSEENDGE
ncbi:hypothetical protein CBR_g29803 [Chara braunii]|uniref:Uncharacterized protein n=1 Tax=Chara braunii TaxID=69332 RepID=A0A388LBF3_CHABU|nr:hypothetical protein CBR_g29803 [Chara braunii]|eukprot:GBG79655.1 hypothetical protein CBR_g29803 [Chara braunii]